MDLLTATIITRNEEKNIERCLCALQGVADEIIVVDSYSTDSTAEICERYGCKVTKREFEGFGSQRQYAAGLASNAYILSVDADEVLDDEMRSFLIDAKKKGFDHRVYKAGVINYICGKALRHSGLEPDCQVRLFNRRYANWNLRDFSDEVSYPDSINPEPLPGTIHHYRSETFDEYCKKENRLAALQAKGLAARRRWIGIAAPYLHSSTCWLRAVTSDRAWLDGSLGMRIAGRRARTAFEAYRMARHIIREQRGL